jgi:hypothetical protein
MSDPVETVAGLCHEVNRAYCEALGDTSQPAWREAPDWQRDSALEGVRAALADPGRRPEDSHAGWLEHKRAEGWTHGAAKDPGARTHPCMVPFAELPLEQRAKDHLFLGVVRACQSLGMVP